MISKNIINELVRMYQTPFYIFEQKAFEDNYKHLLNAFRNVYPNYQIAYSYKTNYTPFICKCVKELGGYAEVVSDMEYTLAKRLGYSNQHIIYNGPCKGPFLKEHILSGGLFNIDSEDEALQIVKVAKENPSFNIQVGIRVNSDIGAGYISRFGIELGGESFDRVVSLLKQFRNIHLVGLHCHISRARGLEAWKKRIDNLLYAADRYFDDVPDYINVGSGMFGEMDESLASQFGNSIPSYEEYAEVVGGAMDEHYRNYEKKPILFSEPGTTVVAKYLSLITKVMHVKIINGKRFATVDSSYYNAGEICTMKNLPYYLISDNFYKEENKNQSERTDIMGYTCLEQDCIYHDFEHIVSVGDTIVFGNVGGYSIVSKPPFIQPNCRVLCYTSENKIIEIKRQESFDDVFSNFIF